MGLPWHQARADAQRHGVIPHSSNYALYADMSRRVVEVLAAQLNYTGCALTRT